MEVAAAAGGSKDNQRNIFQSIGLIQIDDDKVREELQAKTKDEKEMRVNIRRNSMDCLWAQLTMPIEWSTRLS